MWPFRGQASVDYNALLNKPPSVSQGGVSRSLNVAFRPNATRNTICVYSVSMVVTASIAAGQHGEIIFEIASDAGFTANVQTLCVTANGQTYTLAVALQGVQTSVTQLIGLVPAGYYVRLRTSSLVGTPTFAYRAGQEILL